MHAQVIQLDLPQESRRLRVEVAVLDDGEAARRIAAFAAPRGFMPSDCGSRAMAPGVALPLVRSDFMAPAGFLPSS